MLEGLSVLKKLPAATIIFLCAPSINHAANALCSTPAQGAKGQVYINSEIEPKTTPDYMHIGIALAA